MFQRSTSISSLIFLGFFVSLLLIQCKKSDDSSSVAPTGATTIASLNSIVATIDGTQRIFKTIQAPPSKILIRTTRLAVLFTEAYTRQSAIQMSATVDPVTGRGTEYLMIINMMPTTGGIGKFDLMPKQGSVIGNSYFSYNESVNGSVTSYYPSAGTLEITKSDNKTIEGQFSGTMQAQSNTNGGFDASKKSIEVKNGFFKAEIEDAR